MRVWSRGSLLLLIICRDLGYQGRCQDPRGGLVRATMGACLRCQCLVFMVVCHNRIWWVILNSQWVTCHKPTRTNSDLRYPFNSNKFNLRYQKNPSLKPMKMQWGCSRIKVLLNRTRKMPKIIIKTCKKRAMMITTVRSRTMGKNTMAWTLTKPPIWWTWWIQCKPLEVWTPLWWQIQMLCNKCLTKWLVTLLSNLNLTPTNSVYLWIRVKSACSPIWSQVFNKSNWKMSQKRMTSCSSLMNQFLKNWESKLAEVANYSILSLPINYWKWKMMMISLIISLKISKSLKYANFSSWGTVDMGIIASIIILRIWGRRRYSWVVSKKIMLLMMSAVFALIK